MKARIDRKLLLTALNAVKPAVASDRPFVRLAPTEQGTEVAGDNQVLAVKCVVDSWSPLDAADDDTPVMVPHRPLTELLNSSDADDVELTDRDGDEGAVLDVRVGPTDMTLPTVNDDWFPRRQWDAEGETVELDEDQWSMVRTLIPFCATDQKKGNAITTGLWFGPWGVVGTDTYHLACWKHPFETTVAVPASVFAAIRRDTEATITVGEKSVTVATPDGLSVTTSTIQGTPQDYRGVMKPVLGTIRVEHAALAEAMARVSLTSRESFSTSGRQIEVAKIDDTHLRLSSLAGEKDLGSTTEAFECEIEADFDAFRIDTQLLSRTLAFAGSDEVDLAWAGPGQLLMVVTEHVDAFVMPIHAPVQTTGR